jgi:diguanylate cyclase (GGDEF)-like protein/PAS domain S-box-containing protein
MDMKLHPITLKFAGESSSLEEPFRLHYFRESLFQLRIVLILGALLYLVFGILDAVLMPQHKHAIWFVRFMVVYVILGTFLATFSKNFERYMQPLLAVSLVLSGLGIVIMTVIAPIPINYYYYAGLILTLLWGYSFICVRFIWASLAGLVIIILYEIAAVWINPVPFSVLISNNFFFISANFAGMMSCYAFEYYARRDFFMKKQLEGERENVRKINEELEQRVRRRTTDYQMINKTLEKEIADHKKAEELLRISEERYRALVENASDMVFKTDRRGYFTFVNIATIRITGYEEEEIIGKHYSDLIHPDMRNEAITFFNHQSEKEIRNTYSELIIVTKNEKELWIGQNTQLIFEDKKKVGFQAVSRDITERKRLEEELKESEERYRELSIIDDLTQLYNSRHFYHQLKMEIDRLERHEYPLTLLLLDIDDFKVFNDTYGHIEGDQVLFRLGQVIKRCLRKADSAYRYGGEEFTIILPLTIREEGAFIAERIRQELKCENFSPSEDKEVHLTISIGLAQYEHNENMRTFVNRVDHLMYQGKRNGKDRICFE